MKVTVERAELLKSLGHVHRVVERRNTIPILANVLVRAEKSALNLKATDLDLEVIESITADTDIRAFLAPGVPVQLTRAALRRVWETDPAIRDFVGLA